MGRSLDGDGDLDVIVTNENVADVIYYNDGAARFSTQDAGGCATPNPLTAFAGDGTSQSSVMGDVRGAAPPACVHMRPAALAHHQLKGLDAPCTNPYSSMETVRWMLLCCVLPMEATQTQLSHCTWALSSQV